MSREDSWRVEVLDPDGNTRPGRVRASGGSLTFDTGASVVGTGRVQLTVGRGLDIDIRTDRLRITHLNHGVETPCGVWWLAAPGRTYRAGVVERAAVLADQTMPLTRQIGQWLTYPAGSNPVTKVIELLRGRGIRDITATPTSDTLTAAKSFQPTATWQEVCTDLLKTVGYAPVYADLVGRVVVAPYVKPEDRVPVAAYGADPGQLRLLPEWDDRYDLSTVPTGVRIYVPRPNGAAGWLGVADLPDAHPLSAVSRGEEILLTEQGDVNTSAKAAELAARRLAEEVRVTRTVPITTPLDHTHVRDVVDLDPLGMRAEIVARTITLGIGAVVSTSLQWVYDGSDTSWAM